MKVTIDTQEDSKEVIRHVISMLSAHVGSEVRTNATSTRDVFASSSLETHAPLKTTSSVQSEKQESNTGGLFNMFDASTPTGIQVEDAPETPPQEEKENTQDTITIHTY
jgi:hypothetical protein